MPAHDPYAPGSAGARPALVGSGAPPDAGVPATVKDVIAWIGGDPVRARAALAVENEKAKPRVTVVAAAAAALT